MSAENFTKTVAPQEKQVDSEVPTAEQYKEIETHLAAKREELSSAPVDQLPGLVAEIQALETRKSEAFDGAHDEAHIENERIDNEKAAQEKSTQEQAVQAELEAKNVERVAKIDEQIAAERAQLSGASPEQLSEIVARMQLLEAQKIQQETSGEPIVEEQNAESVANENRESEGENYESRKKEIGDAWDEYVDATYAHGDRINERIKALTPQMAAENGGYIDPITVSQAVDSEPEQIALSNDLKEAREKYDSLSKEYGIKDVRGSKSFDRQYT
jgi:hypothetical protein